MKHIHEDEMTLYYYGETVDQDAIKAHLESCGDCRRAYQSLASLLQGIQYESVPERGDDYGAQVWQQIEGRLQDRSHGKIVQLIRPITRPARLAWIAAVAAALVLAFFAGRYDAQKTSFTGEEQPALAAGNILRHEVDSHLETSRLLLMERANLVSNDAETGQRQRARNLVQQNRFYRVAAQNQGQTALAVFLEELERTLLDIANGADIDPEAEVLEVTRGSDHIVFKIKVMEKKIRAEAAPRLNRI